jgi:hypothetical protein
MRRMRAVLVTVFVVTVLAGLAPPASAAPVTYAPPVEGTVSDPFRPPATPYGSGNRGLTYTTRPCSPARASAPGRVTFAGQVGGALHVVVQHADGVRTSYSFLRTIATRVGATVAPGDAVGTTGSTFHFGARIGDAYVDPAILLASGPARVHLVPDGEFSEKGANDDRQALGAFVHDLIAVSGHAMSWARDATDNAASFIDGALDAASREAALHLITVLDTIVNLGQFAGPYAGLAAAFADTLQAWVEDCTARDVAQPRVNERRVVVFVPGLGSSWSGPGDTGSLSQRFRTGELYDPTAVAFYDYSYKGGRHPKAYDASDTTGDLHQRAADLRDLLDQIGRDHPGARVDLIAHSQGGLVAREALAHDYDGPNHVLPPVAHLVTVGTPHHGADAATIGEWLRWSVTGNTVLQGGSLVHSFDLNGQSIKQLAEDSSFIRTINDRPLREGVSYTSIGGMKDVIVPGVRARLAGASNVLVDVPSLNPMATHSGLTTDDAARREVALALNDQPPTCQSVTTTLARGLTSSAVANTEDAMGQFLAGVAARP